ncbi:MAG TPA: hypothetical protein PKE47_10015 [Verrucomicrobiota bacterium]|nr:hypothetical protein [Verrucomicrobiota bacterium]
MKLLACVACLTLAVLLLQYSSGSEEPIAGRRLLAGALFLLGAVCAWRMRRSLLEELKPVSREDLQKLHAGPQLSDS